VVQSEYGRAVVQLNILDDRAINLVLFPKRPGGTMIRSGCKTRRKCVKPAKQASEALSAILVGGQCAAHSQSTPSQAEGGQADAQAVTSVV
jgi:hypothetical protein